jgi:hypothetical protein
MHHSFQSTSYGVDRKPSLDLACVTRERDGRKPGPIAIGGWLHRLMTMLLTDYSMCDRDNDLMVRSNEHEFVERTNASPLLDFCLDDLTHKERDALESELNLAACLQQALLPRHDSSDPGWQICYHYARLAFSAAITAISSNPTLVCFFFWGMSPGRVWPLRC